MENDPVAQDSQPRDSAGQPTSPSTSEGTPLWVGTAKVFVLRGAGAMMTVASTLLVARLFGPAVTGTFYLAVAVASIAMTLSRAGLDLPTMKHVAVLANSPDKARELVRSATSIVAAIATGLTVVLLVVSMVASVVSGNSGFPAMLGTTAFAVLPASLAVVLAYALQGAGWPKSGEFVQRLGFQSVFIVTVVVLVTWTSELAVGLSFAFANLSMMLLAFVLWRRAMGPGTRSGAGFRSADTRSLLREGLPLLLAASMGLVTGWTDILMLGAFGGASDVGVYSVAVRTASTVSFVLVSAAALVGPRFAVLYANGRHGELERLVKKSTLYSGAAAVVLALVLLTTGSWILDRIGTGFSAGSGVLSIVIIGQLIHSATGLVGLLLVTTDRQNRLFIAATVGAVVNVGLNLALIPTFGMSGAAWASVASILVMNVLNVIFVRLDLGISMWGWSVGRSRD